MSSENSTNNLIAEFGEYTGTNIPNEQTNIINSTPDDTLVKGDFKDGKYFSIQFNENGDAEWQISPKIKLTFSFIPKKDDISYVKIQKLKEKSNQWEEVESITLSKFGFKHIGTLLNFISNELDLKSVTEKRLSISDNSIQLNKDTIKKINTVLRDKEAAKNFQSVIENLINNEELVTSEDLVAIGFRKEQLEMFRRLLYEPGFVATYKSENGIKSKGDEGVWQYFFEKNPWIWGYGLSYIWSGPFNDDPVEKVVSGHTFFKNGKRADGVLSTYAEIKNFVVVEIKLPSHELLATDHEPYRKESWRVSAEITGGIAQAQKTKHKFLSEVKDKVELKDESGNPIGESIYAIKPKSYLIIGQLSEFRTEHGVNEDKFSSFELFRSSNIDPEVITYDELYQRAKHIVEINQQSESDETIDKDYLPF